MGGYFKELGREEGRGGHGSLRQCRLNVLCEIDQESGRLRKYQQVCASLETTGTPPEVLRHSVPDAPTLDRLLRYETSLERSFDRTFSQLERLQRMRLGQPVLPTSKCTIRRHEDGGCLDHKNINKLNKN